ncbi:MAG TPA: diacylglycerol kinase family protein [Clostridia bacterium]|nr:diacylglycerol kinase family protein [Clostridia bacterium]
MERLYFIVNLLAGGNRCETCFRKVEAELKARNIPYEYAVTKYRKHAVELAKTAYDNGERTIVAVGGDGTVNEVASVLAGTDAVMGILPFGTGNDLARVLHFPTEPDEALEMLLTGNVKRMDAADVNEHFFINVAGFGFDVDVLVKMDKYKARFKGMIPYLLGILDALMHLKAVPIKLNLEDGTVKEMEAILVAVGNGAYFGGGMMALPGADPFDGMFDICAVRKISLLKFLALLPRFIKGKHMGLSVVEYFRATKLYVEGPTSSVIEVDGELNAHAPAQFTLHKEAMNMIVGTK